MKHIGEPVSPEIKKVTQIYESAEERRIAEEKLKFGAMRSKEADKILYLTQGSATKRWFFTETV